MGNLFDEVVADLTEIGADFRINDLNEALECKYGACDWQLLDDTTEAVIRTELREMGYGIKGAGKANRTAVSEAWTTLAHRQRYNPIKSYFDELRSVHYAPRHNGRASPVPWAIDGIGQYLDNPDGWATRWLFRWMTGCIARLYRQERNPMLVLAGPQAIGKSSFIRWLCPPDLIEFHREGLIKPDVKDERLRLVDTFIQEVPELGSTTRRSDVEALKNHITQKFVVERMPYGKRPMRKPALTSFAGSVNPDGGGFLVDSTGNSRYLCTQVDRYDFEYSRVNINLLWREAVWFYDNYPRVWELTPDEETARDAINAQYQIVNPLEDVCRAVLDFSDPEVFTTALVIKNHLSPHYRYNSETQFSRELAKTMRSLGLKDGRVSFKKNEPHHRGWYGVKVKERE